MKWAWRLGTVAGIAVYVHATFFILIAWVAVTHWAQGRDFLAAAAAVIFILALFACVVLHELGHALTARRYGIRTRDITLLPIGGVARLERMPEEPLQELWVAAAGPAVNVVIALLLFLWLTIAGGVEPVSGITMTQGPFLERLMILNLILVVFNLLPAFPMDGGRIVRALLATRMEYTRATQIAAALGQGMAFLFGFVGFFTNPFLLFIALFVWIGAAQEASLVQVRSALSGIPVRRAMITDFRTLAPEDSLRRAAEVLLAGTQQDFPVVEADRVVGLLLRADLLAALAGQRHEAAVAEVMRREFYSVDSHEMLDLAFARLQQGQIRTAPVIHGGRLVGLVTMENIGEFVAVQAALEMAPG
ncbi:MAG: site-2 protease family protein [Armatimonadota bacterium]|nr:site-2 protease family protein [Armatimonadota bacterium]MDR7451023.1 site-2 protease family protein [Armatimonadota bacterium]MDR7465956.1 site-2 protease family protein [Armatimonadota bacterium]MDR7494021.1 site-2 protease family protein [Armatimonadota bacterium]MDR7498471.1 site-2 protease family protein [Armatimonadota bacterium]